MKKVTILLLFTISAVINVNAQNSKKMVKSASIIVQPINATPDKAWSVIGQVGGVDKWFGAMIKTCSVDGDTRTCGLEDGTTFNESIVLVDHQNKIFRYNIPSQPIMPIKNLSASMRVIKGEDGNTYIEWSGNYDVLPENKEEMNEMLTGAWMTGIKGLEDYVVSMN